MAAVWAPLSDEDRLRYLERTRAPEDWREALLKGGEA